MPIIRITYTVCAQFEALILYPFNPAKGEIINKDWKYLNWLLFKRISMYEKVLLTEYSRLSTYFLNTI